MYISVLLNQFIVFIMLIGIRFVKKYSKLFRKQNPIYGFSVF